VFRRIRVAVLLLVLLFVALNTYFDRVYSTDWDIPLRVAVFPINADGSDVAQRYVDSLERDHFTGIESFFTEQSARYGINLERPFRFTLAAPVRELPPTIDRSAGPFSIAMWSLRMRYWAWSVPELPPGPSPDIRLFVLYHDPASSPSLPHSIGLQKGLFAVVNAFADRGEEGSNDTVIAHELLHTVGATDKYDFASNQPLNPIGIADPDRQPLYPQARAELMGGRIAVSADEAKIPQSLRQVVVGPATASEIRWTR
jgi:hypothetical protein